MRRGHFATYELLTRTFADDPRVQIIWDRRMGERRQTAGGPAMRSRRRGSDRRRMPPSQWGQLNYMFAPEAVHQRPAATVTIQFDRAPALTSIRRSRLRNHTILTDGALSLCARGLGVRTGDVYGVGRQCVRRRAPSKKNGLGAGHRRWRRARHRIGARVLADRRISSKLPTASRTARSSR